MATKKKIFTPWSTLDNMLGKPPVWLPEEDRVRFAAYEKYDQLYWNDPTQYAIRVLEDEQPIYIPNARVIVDTTCQWLMKGFRISVGDYDPENPKQVKVDALLKRERFYSRFNLMKESAVTRGDGAFHITADPLKEPGSIISIDTLHPGQVIQVPADDDPDLIVKIHIVELFVGYDPKDPTKEYLRKLTYHKMVKGHPEWEEGAKPLIYREEAIWDLDPDWWGEDPTAKPRKVKDILPLEPLDPRIQHFPVYWYPNKEWESQLYGSSELRGLEFLDWAVSQGATDTQMALGLEGLGVYATDGGRPVDEAGRETDWEVSPGKVMEVPSGSYFRRVEGVGSITPMMEQIRYLEQKAYAAAGLTDVALGQVDVQVAQSGIALAIKFMPTLAHIEPRDTSFKEITQQLFYDLRTWFDVYDRTSQIDEVEVFIDKNKLPADRVAILNELNNFLDRKIISRKYYRLKTKELGYDIDHDAMEKEILEEAEATAKVAAAAAPPGLQQNAEDAAAGKKVITDASGGNNSNVDKTGNQSNNQSRPNESSGTEA